MPGRDRLRLGAANIGRALTERSERLAGLTADRAKSWSDVARLAAGYRAALVRADAWLPRLWPASPALDARRTALKRLQALPLSPDLPTLGSTRQVLRTQRGG